MEFMHRHGSKPPSLFSSFPSVRSVPFVKISPLSLLLSEKSKMMDEADAAAAAALALLWMVG